MELHGQHHQSDEDEELKDEYEGKDHQVDHYDDLKLPKNYNAVSHDENAKYQGINEVM